MNPSHTPWSDHEENILREMWSLGKTATEVADILPGRTRSAVLGRVNRLKLVCNKPRGGSQKGRELLRKPVPQDYEEMAPTMIRPDCLEYWGCSEKMLTRWIRQTGISPKARVRPRLVNKVKKSVFGFIVTNNAPRRDTFASIAADTLRRNRWVVHQCDEKGRYDPKGAFWRVGTLVLTEDELLQRAAKYEAIAA